MWRKLVLIGTTHYLGRGDPWWPWLILVIDFAGSKCEALLSMRRIDWMRDILHLVLHATAVSLAHRYSPEHAWAISLSTALHLASPYAIPFIVLASTGSQPQHVVPHAALFSPNIVDEISGVLKNWVV